MDVLMIFPIFHDVVEGVAPDTTQRFCAPLSGG
jgi:hypothetical protein